MGFGFLRAVGLLRSLRCGPLCMDFIRVELASKDRGATPTVFCSTIVEDSSRYFSYALLLKEVQQPLVRKGVYSRVVRAGCEVCPRQKLCAVSSGISTPSKCPKKE